MTSLLFIIGAACVIAFFLYMLSPYSSGKKSSKGITEKKITAHSQPVASRNISKPSIIALPRGERMCPLCRTALSKEEALYASRINAEGTAKIIIHGCGHCYKQD